GTPRIARSASGESSVSERRASRKLGRPIGTGSILPICTIPPLGPRWRPERSSATGYARLSGSRGSGDGGQARVERLQGLSQVIVGMCERDIALGGQVDVDAALQQLVAEACRQLAIGRLDRAVVDDVLPGQHDVV